MGSKVDRAGEVVRTKKQVESIYLMRSENGLFKIGRARHVRRRLQQMQTLPVIVMLVCEFPCDNPITVERAWHVHFSSKRVRGEWFRLEPDDVTEFRTLSSQGVAPALSSLAIHGQLIRRLRKAAGLTHAEFANRCGLCVPTVATIEAGRRQPHWDTICKLAKGLGVSVETLH